MMLLWILWTRITVPDSRISPVSAATGTVKPSHPTPRARADLQCTSAARDKQQQLSGGKERATPNIRQISIGEQTSCDFIVRSNFSHKERRHCHLKLEAHCDMELRRLHVPVEDVWRNGFLYGTSFRGPLFDAELVYANFFERRRIWLGLPIEKDFWLPQQVFPLLNYYIVLSELLFFLTFKEPSMKSRSGCWQLHINGYEIRNTLSITKISLHLNRARLLIRRIYCFPTHSLHV